MRDEPVQRSFIKSWPKISFLAFLGAPLLLYIIMASYEFNGFKTGMTTNSINSSKRRLPSPVAIRIQNSTSSTPKHEIKRQTAKTIDGSKLRLPTPITIDKYAVRTENRPRKITDYVKGHKEFCKNTWQKNYTKLHKRLLETNQNKFIIYRCGRGGWGNRIRDILDQFHFAVIAKRAFILHCDKPSALDRLLVPREVNWNYRFNSTNLSTRFSHPVNLNEISDPTDTAEFEKILNYSLEYTPRLLQGKHQFIAKYLKYDLTVWPNLPQMNGCSFYYLFKKSDFLEQRLNEWKRKLGYYDNIVLAIHFRMGDVMFSNGRSGDKRFKDLNSDIDSGFDCALQIQRKIEAKYNTSKVVWFLATDYEKMKADARTKYGSKVKYITGPIEHIGKPSKGNEEKGFLSMFLDFFLMQEADYRLYATHSTFDNAVDFITLGKQNVGKGLYRGKRSCIIPQSLKT